MANNSQSVTYIKKNACHHFVFNFARMKDLQDEQFVTTPSFHALGRDCFIDCYPQNSGDEPLSFMRDGNDNFCSFFVRSEGTCELFDAIISCSLMKRDGKSSPLHLVEKRFSSYPGYWESKGKKSYPFRSQAFVYGESRHMLMKEFVDNGSFELICTIREKDKCMRGIPKPLDLHSQIVKLLGSEETSDVTFDVEGRIFTCHRIILAARSPVFKAELFGNMAEATQKCIKITGVSPVIFEAMLHFVYTDRVPCCLSIPTIIVQHLFEAADRYAIEGLKALCEDKLCASLSLDLFATTLVLAERHSSPRLKNACLDFITEQRTLVTWMLTDEYLDLVRGFPSLKEEIRAKVHSLLMKEFVDDGSSELICTIREKDKCMWGIPKPLDLHSQIVKLLGSEETSDVTFDVKGRIFTCHRIILAARSSVFKAELFGNMAEATQKCIKIVGVSPVAFEAMLHFVYTDTLPCYPQIPTIIVRHLFVAADRYDIEGLKALCEDKLCASLSFDLVATTLVLAERHSSPRLKRACLDFIAEQRTLVTWMLTDEYLDLVRGFPSLKEEIRAKVHSLPSFRNAKRPKLS